MSDKCLLCKSEKKTQVSGFWTHSDYSSPFKPLHPTFSNGRQRGPERCVRCVSCPELHWWCSDGLCISEKSCAKIHHCLKRKCWNTSNHFAEIIVMGAKAAHSICLNEAQQMILTKRRKNQHVARDLQRGIFLVLYFICIFYENNPFL